jgi:hypothetical protein
MGITRRQFLFSIPAVGAGFILPSFFDKDVDVLARTGEPLIIPPENRVTEMLAVDLGSGGFQLNIGGPWEGPPRMTLREYVEKYQGDDPDYVVENYGDDAEVDLDAEADEWDVFDAWAYKDSPNARAYHLLDGLDLGPGPSASNGVGELRFIDGACPG